MSLSVATCYFYDYSPEAAIKHFTAIGCKYIELSTEHSEELIKRGNIEKTAKIFSRFAQEHGVNIPQGHLLISANLTADNQNELLDEMKKWLEFYLLLGIKSAVIHPGGRDLIKQGYSNEVINQQRASNLRAMTDFIKGTDLTICIENIHNSLDNAKGIRELIELAGIDNLGICLDTGHLNMSKGDQGEFIREAGSYLKALHIHDNDGSRDQHILPFSSGNINWKNVMSALEEIKFEGVYNYEIPFESRAPLAIRYAKFDYIKKVHEYLIGGICSET